MHEEKLDSYISTVDFCWLHPDSLNVFPAEISVDLALCVGSRFEMIGLATIFEGIASQKGESDPLH